jgi:IS4 transposase
MLSLPFPLRNLWTGAQWSELPRRYRRRWIVERMVAWLGHFRRLVGRDERLMRVYAGVFHLACALLTLRMVLK